MKKSLFIACLLFMSLVCIESVLGQAPTIANIDPSNAALGTIITINGTDFNASGPNDIFFGSVKVTANADATGTVILVKVPAGAASAAPLLVRNNASGLQASTLQSATPYFTVTRTVPLSIDATSHNQSSYNTFITLRNPSSGDFDNDGYADLIVGQGFSAIRLYRNNGFGDFSLTTTLPLTGGSGAQTIVTGDINADGNLDIVVGKTGTGDLDIFLGNGDLTFTTATSIPGVTAGSGGVALADINNDGYLDLVTNFTSTIYTLIGDGTGSFTEPPGSSKNIFSFTSNPINLAAADFNEDGFIDIVIAGGDPGLVLILLNNQDNTFADPVTFSSGNIPSYLLVGDYNTDGHIDVAVLSFADGNIATLSGDGTGGFTAFAGSPRNVTGAGFHFSQGDFDGDAIIDFALPGGGTNQIPLLKGDGAGGFSSFPSFPFNVAPAQPSRIHWDDFNNDGVADFAFTGNSASFQVLLSPPSFRTTWITTDGEITIPTQGTGYNYDVFWNNLTNPGVGDGVVTGQTGNYTITGLANDDTYQIRIRGDFPRIYFNNGTEKDKIRTIEEWGDIVWGSIMTDAFYGCSNLISNATDVPDLSNVTNMTTFFRNATSFNSDVSQWDLSNVNFMSGMFSGASSFNNGGQPLDWGSGVANVSSMSGVFENATTFNQDISDWDVSSVQNMAQMFSSATDFNNAGQPLNWSAGTGTANVNNMFGMFFNATSFNQDISSWDVSSVQNMGLMFASASNFNNGGQPLTWSTNTGTSLVTNMSSMFFSASSFNQDLGSLDVSSVSDMTSMFLNTNLSTANYDAILEGWGSQSLQNNVPFGASGMIYCSPSAVAARAIIIDTYSWTINDGGVCQPTGQANSIDISNIASTQGLISWTNGNGSDRIVVMREGNAVNLDPSDLTTYTANANFGSGSEIGTGNYVVYNGNGSSTTLSGLNPETEYHFRVYEYNGTAGNENYLLSFATGNPANTSTLAAITLEASLPVINSNNIARNSNIQLDFDADLDLLSINNNSANANEVYDDNIIISGSQSGQLEGVYSVGTDNSILLFTPSNDFKAGEKITVTISSNVLGSTGGNAMSTSFSFIAASEPFEGAFIETSSGILGMAGGSFDWGDYDNDGDLDLIVVGWDSDYNLAQAAIYRNDGGTFTDIGAGLTGVISSSAKWGDYDNDGDLDVVVAGQSLLSGNPSLTTIYRNDGEDTFVDIGAGLLGVDYSSLDWGDYDNDGDLDLIVTGRYSTSPDLASSIIYQNNNGVFTDIGAGLQGLNNGSAEWGDYDADGDLDLLLTGFDGPWFQRFALIYDNDNGVFTDHLAGLPGVGYGDAAWGDYDNDGDLDLILLGDGSSLTYTSIFNNDGGAFTDISAGLPTTSEGSARWGDYDGDGLLDLVITGNDYSTSTPITNIYKNNGSGSFTDINARLNTVPFLGLATFIDFDGDGDLDLFAAGEIYTSPFTSAALYENTTFPTYYSQGSGAFDTPALWNSATDGSGFSPIASNFTDGKTNFIIRSGDVISAAADAISINNFTIEDGGVYQNGAQDIVVFGLTNISGGFSDAVNAGSSTFFGPLNIESTGSFTTSGAISNTFNFHDDISNRGTFDLTSSVFWNIESDLTILNESSSAMNFSSLNSGIGSINANVIVADSPGGGNISLRSNDYIRMADNTTLRNELGDYPTNSRILELAELRAISTSANFENAENAIVLIREGSAGTFDGIGFDFTATDNLVRYFSNGNVLAVDHYHMAVTAGATSLLLGTINVFGDLTIENGNVLDANGFDINIAGNWVNNEGVAGFTPGLATVTFNSLAVDPQEITGATNFNNLVIDNSGSAGEVILNSDVSIASDLTLTTGILNVTDGNVLSFSDLATVGGDFGSSQMIRLAPTALIRKYFDADGSFTYPIGTGNNYNETTITLNAETIYDGAIGSRYIDLNLLGTEEPNVINTGLALTKYWTLNSVNLSNITASLALSYTDLDGINGEESNYLAGVFNGAWSTTAGVDAANNTITFAFSGISDLNANYTAGELVAFSQTPRIDSFTPQSAGQGTTVTLTGYNLTNISSLSFGGTAPSSFLEVSSGTELTAVIGAGTSGNIEIITPEGTSVIPGFTFINAPIVDSFSPATAAQGETVTLTGTDFTGATAVSFGGTPATSFTVVSNTEITAVVGNGSSGNIEVTTLGGTVSIANFTFINAPIVDSFSPATAAQGETVTLIGTDFTDATAVSFGGTPAASFTVVSDTEITAVVGNGSSGNIEVTTPGGTVSIANFTFINAPVVDSFSPATAAQGETVTLIGTDFTDATEVNFGGTPATSFTVVSDTEITAVVGNGSSGNIEVTTPGGTVSIANFTFINAPVVDSFSPATAAQGETVTLIGTDFTDATAVSFGGTPAASFTVVSDTEITAVVGNGSSGNIEVTTPGGNVSIANFTFINAPVVDSFSPSAAAQGETVTLIGTDFTGATAVSFGGTPAASFTVVSDTEITAVVGNGSSGNIEVTTPGGTVSIANFTFINAPVVDSFSPSAAAQGETVTLIGTDFTGATAVSFGGTPAASFTVVSDTEITAVVGNGSSGNIEVTTPNGTTSISGFIFESAQLVVSDFNNTVILNQQINVLDFGAAFTGETITKNFTIENSGTAVLTITEIVSSDAVFTVSEIPTSLNPGTTSQFIIQFQATEIGLYDATVTISSNSSEEANFSFPIQAELVSINVIDNDTESVVISNEDVDLGSTDLNVDLDKIFTVENRSSSTSLEIISITVDNPVFQIIDAPTTIAPQSSADFTVRLIASTVGEYQGTVTVTTSLNEFSFKVIGSVLPEESTGIQVYNVVTPNGDGRHDILQIERITEYPNNTVSIFNRLGNKVFEISNYNNTTNIFEGISNSGQELLTGNYYYVIDKGDGSKRISGFLLIKR